jgi:hypothetical protein
VHIPGTCIKNPSKRSPDNSGRPGLWFPIILIILVAAVNGVSAGTTGIHLEKIGSDGKTVLAEKSVDYRWMMEKMPVMGNGVTHYYHQGPVFVDNSDPAVEESERWNPSEDKNVKEKDMGALKGTKVRDLCDLIGGMEPGDILKVTASDGFSRKFGYDNIYHPASRQGPMVLAWYRADEGFVPEYTTGMRLVFFADNSTNPYGLYVFGNEDWHESASPEYWYYYTQGNERYPTTTGLSVQSVSNLTIYKGTPASTARAGNPRRNEPTRAAAPAPFTAIVVLGTGMYFLARRR